MLEAQVTANELSKDTPKMIQVCRVLLGNVVDNMTIPEIKRDLLVYAKNNPDDFINTINDPMLELQDHVHSIFKAGFLMKKNKITHITGRGVFKSTNKIQVEKGKKKNYHV